MVSADVGKCAAYSEAGPPAETRQGANRMKDLFGEEVHEVHHIGAYAGHPGAGPPGETCRTCAHYRSVGGGSRTYPKCNLIRHRWTGGPGTDIKAKTPACEKWEKPDGGERD